MFDLAPEYGMLKSLINIFLNHKEVIIGADVAKGVKFLNETKNTAIEELEKPPVIVFQSLCKKARMRYVALVKDTHGMSADTGSFEASKVWFEKFKKKNGIHSV